MGLAALGGAVILAVLIVVGDVAAITVFIPKQHPTTLGYIALYALGVLLNGYAWAFTGAIAIGGWEDL